MIDNFLNFLKNRFFKGKRIIVSFVFFFIIIKFFGVYFIEDI